VTWRSVTEPTAVGKSNCSLLQYSSAMPWWVLLLLPPLQFFCNVSLAVCSLVQYWSRGLFCNFCRVGADEDRNATKDRRASQEVTTRCNAGCSSTWNTITTSSCGIASTGILSPLASTSSRNRNYEEAFLNSLQTSGWCGWRRYCPSTWHCKTE